MGEWHNLTANAALSSAGIESKSIIAFGCCIASASHVQCTCMCHAVNEAVGLFLYHSLLECEVKFFLQLAK